MQDARSPTVQVAISIGIVIVIAIDPRRAVVSLPFALTA
jgi:hypothetical protein